MTAQEYLLSINSLYKDKEGVLRVNTSRDTGVKSTEILLLNINKFLKLKCQELLEIVTEKATIYDSKYDGFYIDKRSILNAVDLDSFIS